MDKFQFYQLNGDKTLIDFFCIKSWNFQVKILETVFIHLLGIVGRSVKNILKHFAFSKTAQNKYKHKEEYSCKFNKTGRFHEFLPIKCTFVILFDQINNVQSSDRRSLFFWFLSLFFFTLPRWRRHRHRVRFVSPTDLRQMRASPCALTAYLMSPALEMTKTMSFPSRVFDLGLTSPLSWGLQGNQGVHWHRRGLAQIDPKPFVGIFPTRGPTWAAAKHSCSDLCPDLRITPNNSPGISVLSGIQSLDVWEKIVRRQSKFFKNKQKKQFLKHTYTPTKYNWDIRIEIIHHPA